jgi:predicted nucleic acid-binding protein
MARLRQRVPAVRSKVRGLWNDLLIGLSARQIGAIVVTHNAADFTMLQRYAGFLLRVVPEDF